jgi:hypothetical protein
MAEQTRAATPAETTVTLVESEDVLHQVNMLPMFKPLNLYRA